MSIQDTASGSLIFYGGKNYSDGQTGNINVAHGDIGEIAAGSANWIYQSVAMSGMHAFAFSDVAPASSGEIYLHHIEDVISASIPDLTALYPSAQFPLNYLGLDPTIATIVWLDIDTSQVAPNALASTSMVGGSITSITTLSLPGRIGALGFVAMIQGSSVVANCQYGDYDSASGTVSWAGTGTVVLEYINFAVSLISATGFPEEWTFSSPTMQSDGSWRIRLSGAVPTNNTISDLSADKTAIVNDGVDAATLVATVQNNSLQPVADVTVNWSTTIGQLSAASSVTNANGQATIVLTDSGDTGSAKVVAQLESGFSRSLDIMVTEKSTDEVTLFSSTNYQGTSSTLMDHSSVQLRNALSLWNWKSARLGTERLYAHTVLGNKETFDFRTYRDSYADADTTDLTTSYPQGISASLVQGVALNSDDVVVRVVLFSSQQGENLVAIATQSWPILENTASVMNGINTVSGVLAIFSRLAARTVIPLQVGTLDPGTGLVDWQISTSLIARWDSNNNIPSLTLDPVATPDGWLLGAMMPLTHAGEYQTVMLASLESFSIADLVSDSTSINVDGTDSAAITATVIDNNQQPAEGIVVHWQATSGQLSASTSTTDALGLAKVNITATQAGEITVTASLDNGSSKSVSLNAVAPSTVFPAFSAINVKNGSVAGTISFELVAHDMPSQYFVFRFNTVPISNNNPGNPVTTLFLTDTTHVFLSDVDYSVTSQYIEQEIWTYLNNAPPEDDTATIHIVVDKLNLNSSQWNGGMITVQYSVGSGAYKSAPSIYIPPL